MKIQVYNVTGYLDEHPGGGDILVEQAGKDATQTFEDVGHSDEARDRLGDLVVGELPTPVRLTCIQTFVHQLAE